MMSERRAAPRLDDPSATWERIQAEIRLRVGERNFHTWIAPLRPTWTADGLHLEAADGVACERITRHFTAAIEDALRAVGVPGVLQVDVAAPPALLPVRLVPPTPGHTFANFVVGQSNQAAYGAAHALVDGRRGPLLLHGPSGVGKTHLLHAIHHELALRGLLVACLPAADLVAALVAAYGNSDHAAFWQALGPVHALLLDDVHSLAGQDEMQDRLMEGLAAWMEDGRLLALTSDRRPTEVARLTAAVRTHRADEVVAAIERPEPALRAAILEQKAQAWGLTLDHALATRIAAAIGGNVRRLEGALTRLLAHARVYGRRLDEALALEILPELRAPFPAGPTVASILATTAAVFGVRARLLLGRSRRPELVLPRQVAMYLARQLLRRPFAALGGEFARDHTTVLQAWRHVAGRLGVDGGLARLVSEVERRLGAERS